jgi:hypothetical protein
MLVLKLKEELRLERILKYGKRSSHKVSKRGFDTVLMASMIV